MNFVVIKLIGIFVSFPARQNWGWFIELVVLMFHWGGNHGIFSVNFFGITTNKFWCILEVFHDFSLQFLSLFYCSIFGSWSPCISSLIASIYLIFCICLHEFWLPLLSTLVEACSSSNLVEACSMYCVFYSMYLLNCPTIPLGISALVWIWWALIGHVLLFIKVWVIFMLMFRTRFSLSEVC